MPGLARKLRSPLLVTGVLAALLCTVAPQTAAGATHRPALLSASDPAAAPTQPITPRDTASESQRIHLRLHEGRFCTPYGCGSRSGSPLASAAGFAAAAAVAIRLSRRGDAQPRR